MSQLNPYEPPLAGGEAFPATAVRELPEGLFEALRQTRPWVVFLAILGFIACAFMALGGLALLAFGGAMGSAGKAAFPSWLGLVYLPFALLYVPPCVFMLRYGGALKVFLQDGSMESLTAAMRHQKSFWKFIGMLTAIGIGLYVVVVAAVVVVGIVSAASGTKRTEAVQGDGWHDRTGAK